MIDEMVPLSLHHVSKVYGHKDYPSISSVELKQLLISYDFLTEMEQGHTYISETEKPMIDAAAKASLKMRIFDTGATRDSEEGKLDYEGFLSPLVLRRYAKYLNEHRVQADGKLRDSDNWQKGIPLNAYMKSMWRHFMDLWTNHRGYIGTERIEDTLCAIIFNASGYLHELQVHPDRDKDWVKLADEELDIILGKSATPVRTPEGADSSPHDPTPDSTHPLDL